MPLSCTAGHAVRAVAAHNPDGARLLLDTLAEVAERRADPRQHVREGFWWSLGGRRRSGEALIGRPQ